MANAVPSKDIITALRSGNVPARGLDQFAVGTDDCVAAILEEWQDVKRSRSGFKFIQGAYGAGKSFLCALLRERAFTEKFVTSVVTISRDTPLHMFEKVYTRIVDGLRIPSQIKSCALPDILDKWLAELETKAAELHGLDGNDPADLPLLEEKVRAQVTAQLQKIAGLDSSFAKAIRGYYDALNNDDRPTLQSVIGWLKGERTLTAADKFKFGVKGGVDKDNAFNFLLALLDIIRTANYRGLFLIIDEVELVRRLNGSLRQTAYENIRMMLDRACENNLPSCYLLFTGTDELFEDKERGIPSYRALEERIVHIAGHGFTNLRQPVIRLQGFNKQKFLLVAKRVRELHGAAYNWDPAAKLPDSFIKKFAQATASGFGGEINKIPRGFLREFINTLDLSQTNPDYVPAQQYDFTRLVGQIRAKEEETGSNGMLEF